jgi:hypothetical protein
MIAVVGDYFTDIFLTTDEVAEFCKPGEEANTCIWLLMGPGGWECCCHRKPSSLVARWENGETTAKRDGCEKVNKMSFVGRGPGEIEF